MRVKCPYFHDECLHCEAFDRRKGCRLKEEFMFLKAFLAVVKAVEVP